MLSTTGYSEKGGFSVGSYTECMLKRKVIQKAGRVILLMDRSKLGRTLPFTFAELEDIDVFICDGPLPQLRAAAPGRPRGAGGGLNPPPGDGVLSPLPGLASLAGLCYSDGHGYDANFGKSQAPPGQLYVAVYRRPMGRRLRGDEKRPGRHPGELPAGHALLHWGAGPLLYLFSKTHPLNKRVLLGGVATGFFMYAAFATQTYGLMFTTAGKNALITAVYVVLVPLVRGPGGA